MPKKRSAQGPYFTHMRDAEKEILVWALAQTGGKVSPAADLIAITNGYMRKLMEKHGLLVRRKKEQGGFELTLSPEVAPPAAPTEEPPPAAPAASADQPAPTESETP